MKRLANGVEYYPETDDLLLIRCPKCGRENYAMNVLSGIYMPVVITKIVEHSHSRVMKICLGIKS